MSIRSHRVAELLTVLYVSATGLAACGRSEHTGTAEQRRPLNVRLVAATVVERADAIEAGGVVTANETAIVSSRIAAPVTTVAVRAGDRVRVGDVLVRLDAQDMTARTRQAAAATQAAQEALAVARGAAAAAAAEHTLAAAWHGRIARLRERNAATPQEFDEADARLTAATARVTAAQAAIDQAAAQLASVRAGADLATITESFTVIRAPFDGEVTERFIDPGNLVTPGQPLLQIDASGRRRVEVRVDEARAGFIHPGDAAAIDLDGRRTPLEGTVVEVARAVTAEQRAFTVKVALPRNAVLRTGTFARVRFDGARRRARVVPASAVRSHGQLTSVFVVRDGLARIRLVQIGETVGEDVEILAGLDDGEMVVAPATPELTDGQPVTTEPVRAAGAS